MGGESTEIHSGTTDVVIEAAYWDPPAIAATARRHKLPSEASRRFERAVDPAISAVAAELAAELLVRYGGGQIVGRSDVAGDPLAAATITLPLGEPERLTGRPYEPEVIVRRLEQVGCTVSAAGGNGADGHRAQLATRPVPPGRPGRGGGPAGGLRHHRVRCCRWHRSAPG